MNVGQKWRTESPVDAENDTIQNAGMEGMVESLLLKPVYSPSVSGQELHFGGLALHHSLAPLFPEPFTHALTILRLGVLLQIFLAL